MSTRINQFLLDNGLRLVDNPCISPDFCLDWEALKGRIVEGGLAVYPASEINIAHGTICLAEDLATGDCAWVFQGGEAPPPLFGGFGHLGETWYPATWANLLLLKNLVQEHNPRSALFPTASEPLGHSSLGVGARFTTLHWPGVDWAMKHLGLSLTANQNSIPRELVYDVEAMLDGQLDRVPFPFIGAEVPEGHQGQSVQGMSHGCVLAKARSGFHALDIPWGFNADHQPIGGKYESREDALVEGCLLASYITFDLSPELSMGVDTPIEQCDDAILASAKQRLAELGIQVSDEEFATLVSRVWASMVKMKQRDEKYAKARAAAFTTDIGRRYHRELSIDELPGLTTPATTAVMLALCEAFKMPVQYLAPAFGFQKNLPYADNNRLRQMFQAQWDVCRAFGVSIGVHSGSGKSAENYQAIGDITGGRLEIKTSGRFTYEMGRALASSSDPGDHALWLDWHRFALGLASQGAYSDDPVEQQAARTFVSADLPGHEFASLEATQSALFAQAPSSEHLCFVEYNFLYVLAAEGRVDKAALGDHSPAGYRQRSRFYSISEEARLRFAKNIAAYLIFLARNTGLASPDKCDEAELILEGVSDLADLQDLM
jgi:hypothetical protein